MMKHSFLEWQLLFKHLKLEEFDLRLTLECGQCFQWQRTKNNNYVGVLHDLPVALRQHYYKEKDSIYSDIELRVLKEYNQDDSQILSMMNEYFTMDVSLSKLLSEWNQDKKPSFPSNLLNAGIRLLQQDIEECMVSSITSSNNNTTRIAKLLASLRQTYGRFLLTFEEIPLYTFPTIEELYHVTEEEYRQLGFGYRANYLYQFVHTMKTSAQLYSLYDKWLEMDYSTLFHTIQQYKGIGPKVADFILLSSCKQYTAIPCDTHILQITKRDFHYKSLSSSLNKKVHDDIQELYRSRYGEYCGWTQLYLFSKEILPEYIEEKQVLSTKQES